MKETKVYVDELPKSCWECPCFKNDLEFPCGLSDGTQDYFKDEIDGENCPLKSIKTHDRELVKEVCEKIKNETTKMYYAEDQEDDSIEQAIVVARNEAVDEFIDILDKYKRNLRSEKFD